MTLTKWNPSNEILFLDHEMDPIFEDNLARVLNELPEPEEDEWYLPQEYEEVNINLRMVSIPA